MRDKLTNAAVLLLAAVFFVSIFAGTARAADVYPVVTYSHLSDVTRKASQEVTADYLGAGLGLAMRNGIVIEGTLGAKSLGCVAKDCGRSAAASLVITWRGGRRD
jgi:hypothetical protein